MAFSAQPDHGQKDRKQRGFTSIARIPSKERTKFVPNPAAKPFVPSTNFDKLTRSNKTWSSANRREKSPLKYDNNRNDCSKTINSFVSTTQISTLHQNGSLSNGTVQLHPHSYSNGITSENSLSTQSQPGKHIALHLLSKVLDDETIFNFTSIEEASATPCSHAPASPSIEFDGTSHSWPLSSIDIHPHSAPTISIPNYTTNMGSLSGPNIWSNNSCPATPPLSPDPSTLSCNDMPSFPKPMRPDSLPDCDRFSPFINGFIDDQSPYPSPTGQSLSSSNASPLQTFLPIQEPFCNGKIQQSCESGYASNSTNNSYFGSQMSPSSLHGFVPSSPEVHGFILPLSAPGSLYNSSPSLSPSSPPLGQLKMDRKQLNTESSDPVNSKSRHSSFKDKGFQSTSCKDQNGCMMYSSSPRTKSPFSSELHMRLDDCYEQLRCLEKERKKAETEIVHLWSSRKFSTPGNCVNFRLPPNPSRVDKMVIDQLREHAKVEALVSRIERIRHSPLHQSISESVEQWQQTIKDLQAKRKEEMTSGNIGRGRLGPGATTRFYDNPDILGLVSAVKDVCQQTRAMRTTVWCAIHLITCETIPKVDIAQEKDSTSTSSKVNPIEGMDEVS